MKAIVCTKYGSAEVLQVKEVEQPVVGDNQLLVKVYAASVTTADTMMRSGTPRFARLFLGLKRPAKAVIGTGFSGVIEALGNNVKQFKTGDAVFGETGVEFSANAEYVCIDEGAVISTLPGNTTFAEAAPLCDGAITSLNFLTKVSKLKAGQSLLVNGAAGSLGSAAVQIGKQLGARVTGVCSTGNIEMVKNLGADYVIDYTQQDFTQSGQSYDVIYDTVGKLSYSRCKNSLNKYGEYLSPVLSLPLLLAMLWTSVTGNKKAKFSATGLLSAEKLRVMLNELKLLIESGKFKAEVDRSYPLHEIVEAHKYIDTGHKRGNVILALETL